MFLNAHSRIISFRGKNVTKFLARRWIFIETETTPNPSSLKFKPGQEVLPEAFGTGIYIQASDKTEILRSPLAKSIFDIPSVKSIFFGRDFITVTKKDTDSNGSNSNWNTLRPQVFSVIFDFYSTGKPVYNLNANEKQAISDTAILDTDDEVVASIKELLETRVRPSVQEDGGDIFYAGFDPISGIVKLKLAGACVGCASSSATLRGGVETMLKHYIPEVKGIEDVTASDVKPGEEDQFSNSDSTPLVFKTKTLTDPPTLSHS